MPPAVWLMQQIHQLAFKPSISQHTGLFQTHVTGVILREGDCCWVESLELFHFAKCFSQQPTRLIPSIQRFIFYAEINGKIPMIFKGRELPRVRM